MMKRRISTLAIAGLTSLAVAVTPLTAPNTALLSAAVANAQESALAFTSGAGTLDINTSGNFTVSVPNAEARSKVEFFLDNVSQGTVNVSGGYATKSIAPKSYGDHKVTARYVDPQGFNTREDVTRSFSTPLNLPYIERSTSGRDDSTGDGYVSKVNNQNGTFSKPVTVAAGSNVTLFASMKINSTANTYVYEMGINPPAGSARVDAKRLDDETKLSTTGNNDGTATTSVRSNITGTTKATSWGRNGNPKVNPGFFGMDTNTRTGYWTRDIQVEGVFTAPQTPGIYVPQHSYFKFWTDETHYLRRMDNAVFRVAEPKLPDRKQRTNSSVNLAADQKFVAKQPKDLEITVTPSNAAGTVTVKQGDKVIASGMKVTNAKAVAKNVTFDEPGTKELTLEFTATTPGVNNSTGKGSVVVAAPAAQTTVELTVPQYGVVGDFTALKATVSPAAQGRIDFYDGGTLIDASDVDANGTASIDAVLEKEGDRTIRAVFVPSDKEKFTGNESTKTLTVYAELPAAEENEPEPKQNPAPAVIGENVPEAKDYIANADDLPDGTTFAFKDPKPDFAKEGEQEATVVVTYPDGSTDEVKVTVVVEKKAASTSSTPTSATTTSSTLSSATPSPTSTSKATTSTSVTPTPTKATSTTTKATSTTTAATNTEPTTPTTSKATSTTTTKETSTKQDAPKTDAETYTPVKADNAPTIEGDKGAPEPLDFIKNAGDLPGGTVFEWKKQPDLSKNGSQDVVIEVIYPDGTKDEVKVSVTVKAATKPATTTTTTTQSKPTTNTSATPTVTTTTTSATQEPSDGSSLSSKIEGSSDSQRTALYAVTGILLALLGIVGGFTAWRQFMGR